VDVVLLDVMLPDRSGLELLPELRQRDPDLPVVVITAYSSIESAIEAIRAGAFHYLPKPFKNDEVLHLIQRAAEHRRLLAENLRLRNRLAGLAEIVGTSRAMREVLELVQRAAPARSNILIVGEPGTGKELVARSIHRLSPRRSGPFIPVHTGAIPEELMESTLFGQVEEPGGGQRGVFESADSGTLFLDEVGTLSLEIQARLLGVIQEREFHPVGGTVPVQVDVRIIAATNVDLWSEVRDGSFREDLYYRLNVISIELPPLRNRAEDIPLLALHFLRIFAAENERHIEGFTPRAMEALMAYPWPGNVRELQNVVERAVVLCKKDLIGEDLLPETVRRGMARTESATVLPPEGLDFRRAVENYQRTLIAEALRRTGGVQRQAARLLRLSPTTFNEKVHRLGLAEE